MSLFDDKYNNQNNRKSLGDDIFDGIGSALPFAKVASEKITGHSVEDDVKKIKGYSDSEYDGMTTEQLVKLKRTYFWRMLFLPVGIWLLISGFSGYNLWYVFVGIIALVASLSAIKQYRKAKKHLDVDK